MRKIKAKKQKSVIQELRDIREKMSLEIVGLTHEQLMEYFKTRKTLHPAAWNKKAT